MKLPRPWLLAAALTGCSHAPPPVGTAEIAGLPAARAAPPLSATAAAAPPPAEPEDAPLDCSDEAFAARMKEVAQAEKQADRAALPGAIERALVVRPRDPDLWDRRGRLHLQANALDEAGEDGRVLVEIHEGASVLGWFLRGLAAEDRKEPAAARAFFARAALLDPRSEAALKLGTRSRCTALASSGTHAPALPIVRGWRGVFDAIDRDRMIREDGPPPKTEAEARERACVDNDSSAITRRQVCQGKPPWVVQTGYQHTHVFETIIVPLPAHHFALVSYFTGMPCRGGTQASVRVVGDIIEISRTENASILVSTSECDTGMHDGMTPPCIGALERTTTYHDATTGQARLVLEDYNASEAHELKGSRLRRTGPGGCDETLDLRKLPPELGP